MKARHITAAALAALAVAAVPSTAFAGEITGNGKPTAMAGHAASECGYSGREDLGSASPLRTQTPHEVFFGTVLYPPPGTPGTACNPTKAEPSPE